VPDGIPTVAWPYSKHYDGGHGEHSTETPPQHVPTAAPPGGGSIAGEVDGNTIVACPCSNVAGVDYPDGNMIGRKSHTKSVCFEINI